ncbi:sex-lethal homolog [Drosophila rhopaloa]|uniref:Protein sex-lethal n=1 Tax=Drosophila rhopaloa TaxID=1041015 RepID=A0A6P4EFI4_DRORH|nr:sex-lethal homolog [Drosophila rhopaloa]XP_016976910.1 sex-lethal homolog [Drosophila rhopaloa]
MSNSEKMQGQEHDEDQSSDVEESADNVGRDEGTDEDEDSNGNMQHEDGDNDGDGQEQSGDEEQNNGQGNEGNNCSGQQQQQMDRTSATNLIINYLPQDMTDRELYNLFSGCGPINTCKIMRDFKTGYSFGYGFVDYKMESDSEDAIQKLNGFYVRNKRLKVSYARPGGQSIKDTNLYVINLSRNINDDMLDRIFSPFGLIVQRNILRDKLTGRPRGVAFVRYNKREEAQEAIKALNNTVPEGGSQPIWVRLAEEHGKAKAAQFMSQIGGGNGGGSGGPPHMGPNGPMQPPHHHNNHHHNNHHNPHLPPHHHQQQHPHQHPHHHPPLHHMQHHHPNNHNNNHHNNHHNNNNNNNHHNMGGPHPHHMQQMHPMGMNMGMGVNMGMGMGMGMPIHGGGGGGGGGGGFHHMAHRGRSNRTTRSQKPHPYNHAQKFI